MIKVNKDAPPDSLAPCGVLGDTLRDAFSTPVMDSLQAPLHHPSLCAGL